jgi:hypothetical protein
MIRGLTIKLFLRNPPQSFSTALGHLDLVRKNLRSTKTPPFQPSLALASFRSSTPSLWDSLDPTSLDCPLSFVLFSATSQRHPTLPVSCLLNLAAGINTSLSPSSVDTSTTPHKNPALLPPCLLFRVNPHFFTAHPQPLPSLIVDNETSLECREYFLSQRLPVTFVPPQTHRSNPAERAVRTGKNHLISVFSSTHPDFPDDL